MRFPKVRDNEKNNLYDARIIETNVISAITVCGIAAILNLRAELFMIYCLCYSMHLTINTFIRFKYYFKYSNIKSILLSFLKGLFFIFIPSLITEQLVFGRLQSIYMIFAEVFALLFSSILIYFEKKNVQKEEISIKNGYNYMKIVVFLTSIMLFIKFVLFNVLKHKRHKEKLLDILLLMLQLKQVYSMLLLYLLL